VSVGVLAFPCGAGLQACAQSRPPVTSSALPVNDPFCNPIPAVNGFRISDLEGGGQLNHLEHWPNPKRNANNRNKNPAQNFAVTFERA
jgi:hypothetical protein